MRSFADELTALEEASLRRFPRALEKWHGAAMGLNGREVLNFASNDYLGLSDSPRLCEALAQGVRRYGGGTGASRLVSGTRGAHVELEEQIAAFKGAEAALTFSSGFATAMGVIPALMGQGDVLILDKLCHASLIDAARLSGATLRIFPHNHMEKLASLLAWTRADTKEKTRVMVVTESVFSMDGDVANLAEIVRLKDEHGALLMLDEAHAIGVLGPGGRGLAAALGLSARVDLQMGTLSKALGLAGGYIAARREVIDLVYNRARSFVYTTAPPAAWAFAAIVALAEVSSAGGDERRAKLWKNIRRTAERLQLETTPTSAILPIMIGEEDAALSASQTLLERGIFIPAIRFPTVPRGKARLRLTLSASHIEEDLESLWTAWKAIER